MNHPAAIAPSPLRAWWLAIRPKTLSLSLVPVLTGAALAWSATGRLLLGPLAATLAAALLIQVGTNLHNDAADFLRGADTPDRLGPQRATAQGWLSANTVTAGAYLAFSGALLLGTYLAWVGGWPIVLLGIASLLAGIGYTGGIRPIAYSTLGELFVFLFFGLFAVVGTYYLQTGTVSGTSLVAGSTVGALAAAVLLVNNYRDLETDRRAGKHTLAVAIGRQHARQLYTVLLLAPFPLALGLWPDDGPLWITAAALPLALQLIKRFRHLPAGAEFNRLLAETARLQALFGLLLCGALLWSGS